MCLESGLLIRWANFQTPLQENTPRSSIVYMYMYMIIWIYLFSYPPVIKRDNDIYIYGNPQTKWRFIAGKIIEINGCSFQQAMFDYQRLYPNYIQLCPYDMVKIAYICINLQMLSSLNDIQRWIHSISYPIIVHVWMHIYIYMCIIYIDRQILMCYT